MLAMHKDLQGITAYLKVQLSASALYTLSVIAEMAN